MKNAYPFFLMAFVIVVAIGGCCGNGGDDPYNPPPSVIFGIFDSSGTNNLFDWDGPYIEDSLVIFEDDNITPIDFEFERANGQITLYVPYGNGCKEFEENTYYVHLPENDVDTLITVFRFYPGDGKCVDDALGFHKLIYNDKEYVTGDPEWRFIKAVK